MTEAPALPPHVRALLRQAEVPGFDRWLAMVKATGRCSHPIRLVGETTTYDAGTGEVLHRFSTAEEPPGYLLVACKNRRASVCPTCAETYRRDAFQVIRAGLSGGKGVPDEVRRHPRLFLTLTAPSFGTVHMRRTRAGRPWPPAPAVPAPSSTGSCACPTPRSPSTRPAAWSTCTPSYD